MKDIGGFPEIEHEQSFVINSNPIPRLNLGRTFSSQLRRAGDIDGDGTNDYLYNAKLRLGPSLLIPREARDERTPELEDRTGKTTVFFGGSPAEEEDQFFYRSLRPVGDINGDGHADAAEIDVENKQVRLFLGSPSGYQDSGVVRSLEIDFLIDVAVEVSAFTDLDGDGHDDVLIGESLGDEEIEILYGADSAQNVETRRYSLGDSFFEESGYNTADLDGDTGGRVVRFFGSEFDPVSARIYAVDASRSLNAVQGFGAEELEGDATDYNLSLVDINGSGTREMVLQGFDNSYVFSDSSGTDSLRYRTTPLPLGGPEGTDLQRPVPAGDLDGDGRHDFLTTGPGGDLHVSYGPADLSEGLTLDTPLPVESGASLDFDPLPSGKLGDITGNGRSDLLLSLNDDAGDELGRRYVSILPSREIGTSTDVRFPSGYDFDGITGTAGLGDIDGDGTSDFAALRTDLSQIEVYYGGEPISEAPDQTLQAPGDTLAPVSISSGDVTGDGAPDLVVGHQQGERIDVYEGGGPPIGPEPDRSIAASEAGVEALHQPEVIGDISGDGTADILVSNQGLTGNSEAPERLFLLFGGTPLPPQPDRTIEYDSLSGGHVLTGLGDVSGGGEPDFAVGRPDFESSDEEAEGRVDIYFGEESGSFGASSLILRPETPSQNIRRFGDAVASGDFNGDGTPDLATRPSSVDPSGPTDAVEVSIYHGGAALSDTADRRLSLPAAALKPSVPSSARGDVDENGDGRADQGIRGALKAVPADGEADGLLLASGDGEAVNALLYRPSVSDEPVSVLEAPNQDADLGGEGAEIAVGDFIGNGRPGAVLVQEEDNNDAAISSRFYRFGLGEFPQAAESVRIDSSGVFDFGDTGVDLRIFGANGPGSVTVQKFGSGPDGTDGIEEPNVSSYRLTVSAEEGLGIDSTEMRLAVGTLGGIDDPSNVTIYRRPEVGAGTFDSLETTVGTADTPNDISDDTLYATTGSFSEFVLASGSEPLPVELASFEATTDEEKVRLSWTTASETGNAGFRVQRRVGETTSGGESAGSGEGTWEQIGQVEGAGTTTEAKSYRFADTDLPYKADRLEYRLKKVDTDGSASYTDPVTVERSVDEIQLLGTYPNPARSQATVRYALPEKQKASIRLYDMLGRQVRTIAEGRREGRQERQVDVSSLPSGRYFLRLQAGGQTRTQKLTVVQ